MTDDGFRRALQAFARRRPFRSFYIELHSGHQIPVSHPEAVVLRGDVYVHFSSDRHYTLFQSDSVCQVFDEPTS